MELQGMEWHDGRLEQILIEMTNAMEMIFSHLSTYHRLPDGKTEVWSSEATLRLTGITAITVDGEFRAGDSLADGTLLDSQGNEVLPLPRDTVHEIASFSFYLGGSGTTISIAAKAIQLTRLNHLEKLEDWPD